MKWYKLEDLKSGGGKVIAFWNVKFIEDKFSSNLIVVDIYGMTATVKEINRLINSTISLSVGKLTIFSLGTSSAPDMSKSVTSSPKVPFLSSILTPSIIDEEKSVYLTPTSLTPMD